MAVSSKSDVVKKLAALQLTFRQQLPGKIAEIERLWEMFGKDETNKTKLADMHRMAHSLAGSGGTFGAVAISAVARELEQIFKSLLNEADLPQPLSNEVQQQIDELLSRLSQAAGNWQPSDIPYIKPGETKEQRKGNLLYLVEDDELLAKDLLTKLEHADYRVQHFVELSDFEAAFAKEMPVVILMDVVFKEGDVAGADVIARLKAKEKACPPVIFISVRDDIEARLAAARAGARRYFCKPLDMKKLTRTLDSLTARTATNPYRILLIDDDETLLEYYVTVLREAGMVVEALSNPLQGLPLLADFKPDLVVLDVYMPGCSGPELAQVIRQDDAWAMMPIMFLSTESDLNRQLAAMNLGGDDFLVKPVQADHLVSAVTARAKRARWTKQINEDLDSALRESKYQLVTMDQHDIVSETDTAGQITSVNDRFCEVSGYSRGELLGQNHRMLKSGYHPAAFFDDLWSTISQGAVWHGTVCNRKKNGDEYWVESTIVPFLDDKGKPYKYVSARTDITELKISKERLERSQAYADIGTWDWDIRNDDVYWSEQVKRLYGYSPELKELTYKHFINIVHPEDQAAVNNAVQACLEHGVKYDIEHRVVWPDGSVRWLLERGDVVHSEAGERLHMLGVVQDITARKHAELALAERERQLLEAQALAHIGSWQADVVSGELIWSDEIYRIFGYEPGSIEPDIETFKAAVHPDDLAKVEESEKQAGQTGFHDVIHRIVWPDGTVRCVHELAQAETDAAGNLIRLRGTVQDITDREEAEAKLRETEERLVFAVEGAGDGVWEWDIKTNAMQHSQLTMEMLGYEENELPHHIDTWINMLHPGDRVRVEQSVRDYLKAQDPAYVMEQRLRCKDGSYKWVLSRGTVVERNSQGKPRRMIGIHTDITERKQAEARQQGNSHILELIAKGQPLKEVLEAVVLHTEAVLNDGICSILLLDPSGKYLENGVAPGLPDFYNEAIDGLEIGLGAGSCGEAAFSGKAVIASDIMTHPNWLAFRELAQKAGLRACWSVPFFSSSHAVLGTFAIYYPQPSKPDDTGLNLLVELAQFAAIAVERDLSQQALMVAKEEAEDANRAKSQFLSSMSHELRTPMNAIMGFGQLLQMETDPALTTSQQENVNEIIKAGEHLLELINDVLDLARIEAGRIDLSIETVVPGEVITESLQLITPLAKKRGIEISLCRDGADITVEQLFHQNNAVKADRTRLRQVLLNLLSNAVKYNSENGKIIINCENAGNDQIRISITDTGAGLTRQQQTQLFKAFNRLEADQTEIEGTGIGLVITRNIVELMDGSIGVDSRPGVGSTFWIELPSDALPSAQFPAQKNVPDKKETTPTPSKPGHEHTVLYIEDNPANLRLVTQLLERMNNIHVWSAHEPVLGLELAAEHKPDLILLDINLPGMDGFEVLKHLRQQEATRNTPIIAISANAMPRDIEKGLAAGFDAYITKPVDVSALLHAVDVALSKRD